jgi:glycosyltransferase involved in cell wall biosynthesis
MSSARQAVTSWGAPERVELFRSEYAPRTESPVVSIVIPALNEEITIGEFIDWCWEGLRQAAVSGEIIIVDSSSDQTPQIALARGAHVLRTPKRGLGQAYIDAIPYIRGKFIIMGDCDLTYEFRNLQPFVESYRTGHEFVMGSRFKGTIEDGAMPSLHRYFGTPLTTWILNRIYKSHYSDIHCGMRGITREALVRLRLTSSAWEYASEMVLKASRIGLRVAEVPVSFFKDREGRMSHHRRAGFWSPWRAGWINLKVMLIYSPDSFLIKPGMAFMAFGLFLCSILSRGPLAIGSIGLNVYWMLLGMTATVLGFALFQAGILARISHGLRSGIEQRVLNDITYDRGMFGAFVLVLFGLCLDVPFLFGYVRNNFRLTALSYPAIFGLLMILLGVQAFGFTLLLELARRLRRSNEEPSS